MNIRFVAAAGAVGVLLAVSGQAQAAQAATIPVDLRAVEAQVTGAVGETVPLLLHFSSSAPSAGVHVKIVFPPGTTVTPTAIFQPRCKGPATGPLDCAYTTMQQGDHTMALRLRITSAQVSPGGFALRFEPGATPAPGTVTYVDPDKSNNAAAIRVAVTGASASPSASPSRRPSPSPSPSTESPSPEASPTEDLPTTAATADATTVDALPTAGTNPPDTGVSLLAVMIIGGSIVLVIVGVLLMWLLLRRTDDDDDEGEDFLDTRFGGR